MGEDSKEFVEKVRKNQEKAFEDGPCKRLKLEMDSYPLAHTAQGQPQRDVSRSCSAEISAKDMDSQCIKDYLLSQRLNKPALFENFINHWPATRWSTQFFADHKELSKCEVLFRVIGGEAISNEEPQVGNIHWENKSRYISCTFRDFLQYVEDGETSSNDVISSSGATWAYADYKYMSEIFNLAPQLLTEIDWSCFGFTGRDGKKSTFWMGSKGAYTPCHYDTYGCNLVAQLYGKKKWTLFPPSETEKLYATRVPFEESTVFSQVDLRNCDLNKFPLFADVKRYEITLEPGQVLYVPKHWWHFVECETTAISVNTWIELESDQNDRIKELFAAMLTKSMTDYAGETNQQDIYNPKEVPMMYSDGISLLNNLEKVSEVTRHVELQQDEEYTVTYKHCEGQMTILKPVESHSPLKTNSEREVTRQHAMYRERTVNLKQLLACITHPTVTDSIFKLLDS